MSLPVQRLRVIVHLADGSSYQQFVRKPVTAAPTVYPRGSSKRPKALGLMTCEFRGFTVDLVSPTGPRKDGYADGTFIRKLRDTDKTLTQVVLKDSEGVVRSSSRRKSREMFLGVALYPRIHELVNAKASPLHIPDSGRKTMYLYAADNGLLSDLRARVTVEVTFSDQRTLSAEVIK